MKGGDRGMKNEMAWGEDGSSLMNLRTSSCSCGKEKGSWLIIDSVRCGSPEGD